MVVEADWPIGKIERGVKMNSYEDMCEPGFSGEFIFILLLQTMIINILNW